VTASARALSSNSRRRRIAIHQAKRRRRDSIRAIPKVHQTRLFDIGYTPAALTTAFPAGQGSQPVTWMLDYDITSSSPSGIILNVGDGSPALTVWYDGGVLKAIAGSGSTGAALATAVRSHIGSVSAPQRVRLVVAVRPGDGHLRVWDGCGLLAQAVASSEEMPDGWSEETGSALITTFAATSDYNDLISNPGAPTGIVQTEPVRGYALYVPHHFLGGDPDAPLDAVFDEFLFRATYLNNQLALYPLLDDSE